ncbi:MAG TPA: thiamine-phosphate kinase [Acidimicrobiales bacterium]
MAEASGGGEFAAIARIARRVGPAPPGEVWVGDDAAVVRIGDAVVVAAADALVAGVHADLGLTSLADLGWKALAVNISDVAAMGCVATRALVTISGASGAEVDALYDGLSAAATAFRCPVVGGDLTGGDALVVSVSVLGDGRVDPGPVLRSGARAGDAIWVSGALGAAAAGLRALRAGRGTTPEVAALVAAHARPAPRVGAGVAAREMGATAMIDVSDGFAADLGHVLDASGVGCVLDALPVAPGASEHDAIAGGDDYELVWCAPPDSAVAEGFAARGLPPPVRVGRCVADAGERRIGHVPLSPEGWTHF